MTMFGVSRSLSVTTAGSSTNASFGAVSGVVVEVIQSCAGPAATQPAGKAGATTVSKFSLKTVPVHGVGAGVGAGVPVVVAVAVDVGVGVVIGVGVGLGQPTPRV